MPRTWNTTKVFLLMAALTALLAAIGQALAGQPGLAIAITLAAVTNLGIYWWASRLVLWMYRAPGVTECALPARVRAPAHPEVSGPSRRSARTGEAARGLGLRWFSPPRPPARRPRPS